MSVTYDELCERYDGEFTFGIIKGPSVARHQVGGILDEITRRGYHVVRIKETVLPDREAVETLYNQHIGAPYFSGLMETMAAPKRIMPFILVRPNFTMGNIIAEFRADLGASSNAAKCDAGSIRGKFGGCHFEPNALIADNAVHASDSFPRAVYESELFFGENAKY